MKWVEKVPATVRSNRLMIGWVVLWIAVMGWVSQADLHESEGFLSVVRRVWFTATRIYYTGSSHQCNLCKTELRAFLIAREAETELECPICGSRPRHRTTWIYLNERTNLFDGNPKRMLHVAPEPSISSLVRQVDYIDYLSGDLDPSRAMVRMDVTDIQYPNDSFDVIYCSHVLEHVPADRKGMREFYRVLKPGGWAILAVPILREKTFEDPTVTSPEERARVFGQFDHVRAYGNDLKDRLEEAGFQVTVDGFAGRFSERDVQFHGLSKNDIYFCEKPKLEVKSTGVTPPSRKVAGS